MIDIAVHARCFFSSRRRHTRLQGDWSSDVCSSDLDYSRLTTQWKNPTRKMVDITKDVNLEFKHIENPFVEFDREPLIPFMVSKEGPALEIGRASCRERV